MEKTNILKEELCSSAGLSKANDLFGKPKLCTECEKVTTRHETGKCVLCRLGEMPWEKEWGLKDSKYEQLEIETDTQVYSRFGILIELCEDCGSSFQKTHFRQKRCASCQKELSLKGKKHNLNKPIKKVFS